MLAEAEVEVKAREMDEKLKRLKKKVESSSESEEEVRPRRVEPEPVFETVSASRSQIQHELQMMRREMAMRAMVQAPALWINEPLDPARHGNETQVCSQVSSRVRTKPLRTRLSETVSESLPDTVCHSRRHRVL